MEEGKKTDSMVEVLKKRFNRLRLVSTLYASGVLLDFFLVYTVKINDVKKCIELNNSLGYTAFAFRTLLEILNMIIFFTKYSFKKFNFNEFIVKLLQIDTVKYTLKLLLGIAITKKEFPHFLMFHQFLSIFLVAIVCQVMLMISLTSSKKGLILIALYYLLGLHLPRLCAVIAILLKRPKTSSSRFRTKMFRLFFFVFIYSIQLFAALWYLPATYKETRCWKQAYTNFTGPSYSPFNCSLISEDIKKNVSDYCSENTTNYDFGIYKDVHGSGVLGKSSLLVILYFSRWALQYLSSFAQGLEAGVSVWQNIFIIFIIFYAVFMFFFLIGEVQSEKEKFAKLRPKLLEKKQWMGTKNIPEDLQSQIRKNERDKWPEIKDVTIENMFNNLPKNVSGKLSEQLCLEQLKKFKVEEFGQWNEELLKELADCVKPIFYEKRTQVVREKDPIVEMLFVVQGVLWTYPSRGGPIGVGSTSSCSNKKDHMKNGDIYGEELVKCIQADPYSFNFPISTKTIQAVTNVEAFVLMAYDLKNIFIKRRAALQIRSNEQTATQEAKATNSESTV